MFYFKYPAPTECYTYCHTLPLQDAFPISVARLIDAGKVRVIGPSNFSAARFSDALAISKQHGLPRYETLQPEYNLVSRAGYEQELEPLIRRENIGVISYYALASGFLSGKYRSDAALAKSAPRGGAVKKFLNPHGLQVLAALDAATAPHPPPPPTPNNPQCE